MPPDWQNPDHRLVGQQLSPLLRAAGREPATCEVFFLETEKLNAASLGKCRFAFTTGLAETRDPTLISGVAAHEVAHEVLSHAEKRETITTTLRVLVEVLHEIPEWGPLATLALIPLAMVALPAYARPQEANADAKAVEILQARGALDPAGTMLYAYETLLAREGPTGGGILSTHPDLTARIAALRELQAAEPCTERPPPEVAEEPVFASEKPPERWEFVRTSEPPDPRASWTDRYKKMAAQAITQAKDAEAAQTNPK